MGEKTKRRTVLFITRDMKHGGSERALIQLLMDLDRQTYSARLFVLDGQGEWLSRVPSDVAISFGAPKRRFKRRYDLPLIFLRLLPWAFSSDVIVGTTEGVATYLAYLAGLVTGRPNVGWLHTDLEGHAAVDRRTLRAERVAARYVYRRLKNLVAVSKGALKSACAYAGFEEAPQGWRVIYNSVTAGNEGKHKEVPRPEWAADALSKPVIVGAGRLAAEKGFDMLLEAFALVFRRGVSAHLVIAGEGPDRQALERKARELGVKDNVWFPGWIEDIGWLLEAAGVFVLSSRYEGFGLVLAEALAAGAPVVAFDCPSGPTEILDGGKYGVLIPANDVPAMASAISEVLGDEDLGRRLREKAKARALDFSAKTNRLEWERVLAALVS